MSATSGNDGERVRIGLVELPEKNKYFFGPM